MYQDLEARLHDLFWATEADADESPLLLAFLNTFSGKVLEVGCGSGRLLLPLLEKGFDMEGVEISADMVAILKDQAQKKEVSPVVHHADISQLSTSTHYDAFTIPAFTLQLFTREAALSMLKKLRSLAKPNAGLYITVFIPWSEILDEIEPSVWQPDKEATLPDGATAQCHTRHEINRISQTLSREHHYTISDQSGSIQEQQHVQQNLQWYLLPELILMLGQSGWKFDSYDADFSIGNQDSDASLLTLYASAV